MSFVYGITDQLTGYPYAAGALAAMVVPFIPIVGALPVPGPVWGGLAGYTVGAVVNDYDCAILKGIAGGVGGQMGLEVLMRGR